MELKMLKNTHTNINEKYFIAYQFRGMHTLKGLLLRLKGVKTDEAYVDFYKTEREAKKHINDINYDDCCATALVLEPDGHIRHACENRYMYIKTEKGYICWSGYHYDKYGNRLYTEKNFTKNITLNTYKEKLYERN